MKLYRIPTNYSQSGKVFRGMIDKRNLVDAIILGVIGYFLASLLGFDGDSAISGYILIIGLFFVFGIIGIHGIPVSVYVIDAKRWRKRKKKPYLYNNHGGVYTVSAADIMLNAPQLRDTLADAIDRVRAALTPKKPDYIEGETFQFAEDPELLALQAAQEALEKENDSAQDDDDEAADSKEATTEVQPEPAAKVGLNIKGILKNLNTLEEGERNNEVKKSKKKKRRKNEN